MASPDSPCGIKEVDIAINYAVEEKDDTYQDLLTRLSAKQRLCLSLWLVQERTLSLQVEILSRNITFPLQVPCKEACLLCKKRTL